MSKLERIRKRFLQEDGVNTIEIVLIIVVIIAVVLIFKNQILALVESIFGHINSSVNEVY
ncbi:MAG: hypothetical protein IKS18_06355 [Lachnospiraceae bacterium]|nr:hypothetical protein [Lachnospiraceae bacterium]